MSALWPSATAQEVNEVSVTAFGPREMHAVGTSIAVSCGSGYASGSVVVKFGVIVTPSGFTVASEIAASIDAGVGPYVDVGSACVLDVARPADRRTRPCSSPSNR